MCLEPGRGLLHYRLVEKIGEGGMGVVWKARDTRLDRTVAIKVLPEGFRRDPERSTRLEREAKLLAALNHANVASIYGFEEAGDLRFLVLEYVPGESLDERIACGPLPVEQAIRIARQIVDAVEAAHRDGIVHRDLKPANIKVTPDEQVKVLDFGLAKALVTNAPTALHNSPTMTGGATQAGVILGTASYMSPEQARGQPIDARTDIWAFGCIAYEMLTGSRAFGGTTVTDVLAGIVHKEPDWDRLPRSVPQALVEMLRRCVAKGAAARPQEIGLLRPALEAAPARPAGRPMTLAVVGVAAAILLILALGLVARRAFFGPLAEQPAAVSPDQRLMLVVLPFDNLGADPDREFFADGMTEEVIAQLAKLSPDRLGVIARTSSMHYKGADKSIEQIGRELGVGYVLEGSVRLAGERVRINAQLIDVTDQTNLWAETYERDVTEIFAIQGDVASRVARSLSLELLPGQREQLSRAATMVPAAHEAYLEGRSHWNKRTVPGLRKSIELFRRATRLDPDYAEAWRGLADGWAVLPDYDPSAMDEALPEARRAAYRALELDPTLVEARAPLAMLLIYEWEWEAAESALRQVIAERPGFATARHWYAWLLIETNRKDEALQQIRRARELDPLSIIINSNVAQMLLSAERYEDARAEFERVLEMDPDFAVARINYAFTLLQLGRGEEAIEILEALRSEFGDDAVRSADLAWAHALVGNTAEANRWFEEARATVDTTPLGVAAALVALGRNDEALTVLERGCAERNVTLRHLFTLHFAWEPLESDPRFQAIEACLLGR